MTTYVLVGLRTPPKSNIFDPKDEHRVLGGFPTVESFTQFVLTGQIPIEWPYYAVIAREVKFYVLASREFSTEDIARMAENFGQDDWKRLLIARGPYEAPEQAYDAFQQFERAGLDGLTGVYVGSMEDDEAEQLKRLESATQ